jgi:predicted RND superfamily exporter protein
LSLIVSSLFHRLASLLMRRRVWFALSFAFVVVAVGAGAAKLRVDFSARAFFGGDPETLATLDAYQSAWGADDAVVLVVAQSPRGSVLTRERLEAIEELRLQLGELDGVGESAAITSLRLPVNEGGTLAFKTPLEQLPEAEAERRRFAAELQKDALISPVALSADGRTTGIALEIAVPPDDIAQVRPVVEAIDEVLARGGGDLELSLAGRPVVRSRLLGLILGDQVRFVPVSFLAMAFLLLLLFRRFHGVFLPLLVAGIPAGLVMGVMGYLDQPIGVVNQVYFTLLPVIAVSGGIHFLSRYYEEANRLGAHQTTLLPFDRRTAILQAVRFVGGACLFSAMTTVIGLLSLQLSSMPILRAFGLYSAVGVGFAFITLVVLVPLILSVTRGRVLDPELEKKQARMDHLLAALGSIPLRFPRSCVAAALLVLAGAGWLGSFVVVDNSLSGMLEAEHPTTRAGRVVDEHLAGLVSIEVDLLGEPSSFHDPAVLAALQKLEKRLAKLEGLRSVHGPAAAIARANEALTEEPGLPGSAALAAQLGFLAEGQGYLERFVNDDRSRARIVVRSPDVGARAFAELEGRVRHSLDEAFARPPLSDDKLSFVVTGTASASYAGILRLAEDLRLGILTAFGIILFIIIVIFRSLRVALISILPNGLPLAVGYGLVGLLGWPLEPGPAVVFTVALGIAVDDTIHLLARTSEARASGLGLDESIREAIIHTGRPVIITTVILTAGFAINMASSFPNNARVGALGAFVIFAALVADLFVLPALLKLFGERAFPTPEPEPAGGRD